MIGLPAATPKELMNSAKYAFGDFENCTEYIEVSYHILTSRYSQWMDQWICVYPEFLGTFVDYRLVTRHRHV